MIAFLLALVAGIASPMQASFNTRLREELKSPYTSALVNFCTGVITIIIITAIVDHGLHIPLGAVAEQPLWIWLGGPSGTAIVILNVLCVPKLGAARNVMLICFGQTMTGLLIDHFGFFRALQIPMSYIRVIGALLTLAGIACVSGLLGARRDKATSGIEGAACGEDAITGLAGNTGSKLLYDVLAMLCGAACSIQVAVNGTLKQYAGSMLNTTTISVTMALITTAVITVLIILFKGTDAIWDGGADHGQPAFRWWLVTGGFLGLVVVATNAVAAPVLGTGVVTILNLVGMMGTSLIIDAEGFLGIEKQPVTAAKVLGMLLMIAGAALISLM